MIRSVVGQSPDLGGRVWPYLLSAALRRCESGWGAGVGTRGGMTFSTVWRSPVRACDDAYSLRRSLPRRLFGGVGLAGVASVCAWVLCSVFAGSNSGAALAVQESPAQSVVRRSDPAPAMFEARFYVGAGGFKLASAPQPEQPQYTLASLPSLNSLNSLEQDVP